MKKKNIANHRNEVRNIFINPYTTLLRGKILITQLSQVSLTLYLLGVKKELSGVNSATLHGVKRTFDCLRMRFKRKSIVMSEAVTPFYFTKLTPVYYLRNFSKNNICHPQKVTVKRLFTVTLFYLMSIIALTEIPILRSGS